MPQDLRNTLLNAAGLGIGAATGGAAGAAAGLNITANNYLKHHEYEAMLKELGKCQGKAACDAVFSKYKQISDKHKAELLEAIDNQDVEAIRAIYRDAEKVLRSHIMENGHRELMATPGKLEIGERFSDFSFESFDIDAQGRLGIGHRSVNELARTAPQIIITNLNRDPEKAARNWAFVKKAGEFIIDFTPVIGDIKSFAEAETKGDYFFATLGVVTGPFGDAAKKLHKAHKAYEAAKAAKDVGKMKTAMLEARKGVDLPYDSRQMRTELERRYGPANVTSTTVPAPNNKNVKLAGKKHPATDIVFDKKGFPIFDDIAKYDTRIDPAKFKASDYKGQMKLATKDLAKAIDSGVINKDQFTPRQLDAIKKGNEKIPGYTWHHHQDTGRMQLVPERRHSQTGHIGGEAISKGR